MTPSPIAWLKTPASPQPLGWFRIAVCGFFFVKLWVVRASLLDLHGERGLIPWAVSRGDHPGLPHLADLAALLARWGVGADDVVRGVVTIFVIALALLLVGVWARFAALVAWGCNLLLMHAAGGTLYGMDYFSHIALSYCVIMPVADAVSLPRWLSSQPVYPSVAAGLTRRLLQLQLSIVYTVSGIEKAKGAQWWNGEAIWRVLSLPSFNRFDVSWLAQAPALAMLAGWSVIVIESGYAVGMAWHRTRRVWLCLVVAMHLGIGLCLGMWLFAGIMLILSVTAFAPEALCRARLNR